MVLPDSRNKNGIITAIEKSQSKGKSQTGACVGERVMCGWLCRRIVGSGAARQQCLCFDFFVGAWE